MIQAPNMIRELNPRWTIPLVASLTLSHQVKHQKIDPKVEEQECEAVA